MRTKTFLLFFFLILFSTKTFASNDFTLDNCINLPDMDKSTCELLNGLYSESGNNETEMMNVYFELSNNPFASILTWNSKIAEWYNSLFTEKDYTEKGFIEKAYVNIISVDPKIKIDKREYLGIGAATILTDYGYTINTSSIEKYDSPKDAKVCATTRSGYCRISKEKQEIKDSLKIYVNKEKIGEGKKVTFNTKENNNITALLSITHTTTFDYYDWSSKGDCCRKKQVCTTSSDGSKTCKDECIRWQYTCEFDHKDTVTESLNLSKSINYDKIPNLNTNNIVRHSSTSQKSKTMDCKIYPFDDFPMQRTECSVLKVTSNTIFFVVDLLKFIISDSLGIKQKSSLTNKYIIDFNRVNLKKIEIRLDGTNINMNLGKLSYDKDWLGRITPTYNYIYQEDNGANFIEKKEILNDTIRLYLSIYSPEIKNCSINYIGFFENKTVSCKITELSKPNITLTTDKEYYQKGETVRLSITLAQDGKPVNDYVTIMQGGVESKVFVSGKTSITTTFDPIRATIKVSTDGNLYKAETSETILLKSARTNEWLFLKWTIIILAFMILLWQGTLYLLRKK